MHPNHRITRGHRPRRLLASAAAITLTALAVGLVPATGAHAADTSVTVDFSVAGGAPTYHAAGTLYGMTPDGSLPPDHFYTDIKWHFERAGGAQLNSGGYATSLADYQTRWNATLAQYKRTAALGGTFILLPHDLWGADSTTSQPFPGDNGDWTTFDNFLNQLFSDVKANNMTVEWDLWNEPNGQNFWPRPETQYLAMWSRFYAAVRANFPGQLIVGPSYSQNPTNNTWWSAYLPYVKANNAVPDIWSWHAEAGDPVADTGAMNSLLSSYGLSNHRPYQINEYATLAQQNPGGGAWYISRLERAGADGLRGNWFSGKDLHNYEANLVTSNSSGVYLPLGEWFMYRYYGSQTGNIVNLTPGTNVDGLATKDNTAKNAKILIGSNGNTGNVTVDLNRLDTTSVVQNGQVRAIVQRIPYNNEKSVAGPVTISDSDLTVSNNAASVTIPYTTAQDGYTITLLPPSNATISTVAVNEHSGLCLDDKLSASAGTQYQQSYCDGGYQQMLDLTPVTGRSNTYTVVNEHSGLCMDVSGNSTANNGAIIQWTCNGQTNQMFTLSPVTALGNSQDYQLVAVNSGKCVDVFSDSSAPSASIAQYTCDTASTLSTKTDQIWRLLGKA